MSTLDELQRSVERLNRAVSNLKGLARHLERYDPWSGIRPKSDAADIRLLLSERAELLDTLERMRGALIFYADQPPVYPPSFGPWGVGSTDFGHRARAALTTGEATTPNAGERG